MKALMLALCALLLAGPAWGTIHVVTTDGSPAVPNLPGYLAPETAAGTSIATVLGAAAASDTVYVHSGTYDERIVYTDWNADNIVLLGARDKTSEIRWTGPGDTNYMMSAGDRVAGFTGATIRYLRFDGDGFNGIGMLIAGAEDATITDCVWEGGWRVLIAHGVGFLGTGHNATNVTVDACSLATTYTNATSASGVSNGQVIIGTGSTIEGARGVSITNSTFHMDTGEAGTDGFQLTGVFNFTMTDCDIWLPDNITAASTFGISLRSEAPAEMADGVIIRDCNIYAQEVTGTDLVTVSIGRNAASASGIVDNVTLERLYVSVPPVDAHFGIKVEADYNVANGDSDDNFSDSVNIINCTVIGGRTGIGFHENTRNSTMTGNRIIGPGNQADAGYLTFGIVVEDARHVNITNNWVSNVEKALTMSHSGNLTPTIHNYDVRISGNLFENAVKGINLQYFESSNTVTTDSLMICQGNMYKGVTNIGYLDVSGTDTEYNTIAAWKLRSIPLLGTSPHLWTHADGEIRWEDGDATGAIRRAGASPAGIYTVIGPAGPGIR